MARPSNSATRKDNDRSSSSVSCSSKSACGVNTKGLMRGATSGSGP